MLTHTQRAQTCLGAHVVSLAASWIVFWFIFCLRCAGFKPASEIWGGGWRVCRTRINHDVLQWCVERQTDGAPVCHHVYSEEACKLARFMMFNKTVQCLHFETACSTPAGSTCHKYVGLEETLVLPCHPSAGFVQYHEGDGQELKWLSFIIVTGCLVNWHVLKW